MNAQKSHDMTIDVEATDRSSRPGGDASLAWAALAKFVLGSLGLFYPPSRMNDLRRNFAKASIELGYADEFACMRWIVAPARTQVELRSITQVLARHLTIGETYFLRDRAALDAFESSILPKLIHERRVSGNLRLRLWCAACCTGEEAYTLAVMIHRLLPDIAKWQITITATDLNLNFLQKAREAVYGEWSFRDAPVWLKSNYFKRLDDGRYRVVEEIRRMVDFVQLNLVDAQSISMPGAIRGEILSMDIVFCRNVLMYFDAANVNKAVGLIEKSLVSNGWLAVGPGETASIAHPSFDPVSFPGAVLLRKKSLAHAHAHAHAHTNARARNALEPAQPVGAVALDVSALDAAVAAPGASVPDAESVRLEAAVEFDKRIRRFVAQGQANDALAECDRWLAADKLNAAAHYLRGALLMERSDHGPAHESLQRAAYLDPDYILAHIGMGHEALRRRETERAVKHFTNAHRLLADCARDEPIPGGDGLTAEQVAASLRLILRKENVR